MPASIGLTHLKLRTTPRHNYEQRLAALTLADEEERRELSSMWRNSTRCPAPRGPAKDDGGPTSVRPTTMHSTPGATRVSDATSRPPSQGSRVLTAPGGPSAIDLTVAPLHPSRSNASAAQHQNDACPAVDRRPTTEPSPTVSAASSGGGNDGSGSHRVGRFLSPPTVPIRGPNSYMEDPRRARLARNAYMVYYQSPLHDVDVARALVHGSSSGSKRSTKGGRATQADAMANRAHTVEGGTAPTPSSSGLGLPSYILQVPQRTMLGASRLASPASVSGDVPSVLSLSGDPSPGRDRKHTIGMVPDSGPAAEAANASGMMPMAALVSALGDSWVDNDSDDLGFTPRDRTSTKKKKKRKTPTAHNEQSISMSSRLPTTAPLMGTLPSFGGTPGNAQQQQQQQQQHSSGPSVDGSHHRLHSSLDAHKDVEDVSPRLSTADANHKIDPQRLRQFKSRYGPPPIDVMALKPKCAVLHVKLEKLSLRMKAEDDEFAAFRDNYLKTLGCR